MRSTTWMAVLPTSPVDLRVFTVLLMFIGLIVAISDEIAYYEIQFYKANVASFSFSAEKLGRQTCLKAA